MSANPDDPNMVARTIIDGGSVTRGFIFANGEGRDAVLDGVTITNCGGISGESGGGIYIDANSSPRIVNVSISNCNVVSASGGGIYIDSNSNPTFINVEITSCSSDGGNGGGIYLADYGVATFMYLSITDCSAIGGSGGS